jgi:hypothetical protein
MSKGFNQQIKEAGFGQVNMVEHREQRNILNVLLLAKNN